MRIWNRDMPKRQEGGKREMSEEMIATPCKRCGRKTGCGNKEFSRFCDSCNQICPKTAKGERCFSHSIPTNFGGSSFGGTQNIGIVRFQVWGFVV